MPELPARVAVAGAFAGTAGVPSQLTAGRDRHGCRVAERRQGALAIPVPAALVGARLGREHPAIDLPGIHDDRRCPTTQVRKLCGAAALVGAAGLAVAWIGSVIGPAAILVQGQAWRWVWVAVFVARC